MSATIETGPLTLGFYWKLLVTKVVSKFKADRIKDCGVTAILRETYSNVKKKTNLTNMPTWNM